MTNTKNLFIFAQIFLLAGGVAAQSIIHVNQEYIEKSKFPIESAKGAINTDVSNFMPQSKRPEIESPVPVDLIQEQPKFVQPLIRKSPNSTGNSISSQMGSLAQNDDVGTVTSVATPSVTSHAPALGLERLSIQPGQRLSIALGTWLKSQSIELSWEPTGTLPGRVRDIVIDSAWLASQTALEPTLSEVLAPFGLTAHILSQRQTTDARNVTISTASPTSVVVRNASNARP